MKHRRSELGASIATGLPLLKLPEAGKGSLPLLHTRTWTAMISSRRYIASSESVLGRLAFLSITQFAANTREVYEVGVATN